MNKVKEQWYQQTTGIAILLLLFFPVGIFLMWKYADWNKWLKIGLSILAGFALVGAISSSGQNNTQTSPRVAKQVIGKRTATSTKKVTSALTATPTGTNQLCDVATMDGTEFDRCLRLHYPLPATVKTNGISLFITNPQNVDWTGCSVQTDDGTYEMNGYDNFNIPAGETESLGWGRLVDGDGNRLNYFQKQPGPIDISCFVGKQLHESQFQGF